MSQDNLRIIGAREHNLKNINIEIPRDKLVVLTGISGSGKSSLAFDTIFAEGQRRYVESLSSYARQFLGQMNKPDVDSSTAFPRQAIDRNRLKQSPFHGWDGHGDFRLPAFTLCAGGGSSLPCLRATGTKTICSGDRGHHSGDADRFAFVDPGANGQRTQGNLSGSLQGNWKIRIYPGEGQRHGLHAG